MKKIVFGLTLLALSIPTAAFAQEPQPDCEDFESQAAAQAFLRKDTNDPAGLDGAVGRATESGDVPDQRPHPGDGIACESLPGPFDRDPVPVSDDPPPAGGQEEGKLPFTGVPVLPTLALGLGLIGAGGLMLRRRTV